MKVAFIVRPNLYKITGGDTVQIDQTANQLRKLGVEVDIFLSNATINYSPYQLLNFFHITRPAAILRHSRVAGKPFAISTIYCSYGDYYKRSARGLNGVFARLPENTQNYLRIVGRWLLGREHLPIVDYLWRGQRKTIIEALSHANIVLPNSVSELKRLEHDFLCKINSQIVTNGINPEKFPYNPAIAKDEKLVICVGRVESRKNQLNLIKALNNTDYRLVLIGAPSPYQMDYYQDCIDAAGPNVTFLNHVPHEEMLRNYQVAKVHVLASWFETTGLSSLEAAIMGCNIVVTEKGDTRDYFMDDAFYCDPADISSIRNAVDRAAKAPLNNDFLQRMLTRHTWAKAAEQTLEAYQSIL